MEGVASSEIPPFPTYTSPERAKAILLCGWDFVAEGHSLEDYLKRWSCAITRLSCDHSVVGVIVQSHNYHVTIKMQSRDYHVILLSVG